MPPSMSLTTSTHPPADFCRPACTRVYSVVRDVPCASIEYSNVHDLHNLILGGRAVRIPSAMSSVRTLLLSLADPLTLRVREGRGSESITKLFAGEGVFDPDFVCGGWAGIDEPLPLLVGTEEPRELKLGKSNVAFLIDLNLELGDDGALTDGCGDAEGG